MCVLLELREAEVGRAAAGERGQLYSKQVASGSSATLEGDRRSDRHIFIDEQGGVWTKVGPLMGGVQGRGCCQRWSHSVVRCQLVAAVAPVATVCLSLSPMVLLVLLLLALPQTLDSAQLVPKARVQHHERRVELAALTIAPNEASSAANQNRDSPLRLADRIPHSNHQDNDNNNDDDDDDDKQEKLAINDQDGKDTDWFIDNKRQTMGVERRASELAITKAAPASSGAQLEANGSGSSKASSLRRLHGGREPGEPLRDQKGWRSARVRRFADPPSDGANGVPASGEREANRRLACDRLSLFWNSFKGSYPWLAGHLYSLAAAPGSGNQFLLRLSQPSKSIGRLLDEADRLLHDQLAASRADPGKGAESQLRPSSWISRVVTNPVYARLVQYFQNQRQSNKQQQQRPLGRDESGLNRSRVGQQEPVQLSRLEDKDKHVYGRVVHFPHDLAGSESSSSSSIGNTLDKLRQLQQNLDQASSGDTDGGKPNGDSELETNKIRTAPNKDPGKLTSIGAIKPPLGAKTKQNIWHFLSPPLLCQKISLRDGAKEVCLWACFVAAKPKRRRARQGSNRLTEKNWRQLGRDTGAGKRG